ncbi:MAG: DNA polymerase I [Pseudomonadota bacterium]
MEKQKKQPTLYIIDIFNLIFRAYYAMPSLRTSGGEPTGAIFGVVRMVLKIIREMKPDCVAVAMDSPVEVERKKIYAGYKANRPPPPEDLVAQIPSIERIVQLFGIRTFTKPGWEADDVIASLTGEARKQGMSVRIVSSDKDLMQLVDEDVKVLYEDTRQKTVVEMDRGRVEEKYGVGPERILDLLTMVGDSSDNIPGIPKIGQKTAASLLKQFGSLDAILEDTSRVKKPAQRKTIEENRDVALLSRRLATLKTDLFDKVDFDGLRPGEPDTKELAEEFRRLELRQFLRELAESQGDAQAEAAGVSIRPSGHKDYVTVFTLNALDEEIARIREAGAVSVDLETTGTNAAAADIVGVSLSCAKDRGCYVPVRHLYMGAPKQLGLDDVLERLRPVLQDPAIEKYGHHIKFDDVLFMRSGVAMQGIAFDTMIASYLLDPEKHQHSLDQVAMAELGYRTITYGEVTRKSRKGQLKFEEVPVDDATQYAAEDAEIVFCLVEKMRPDIEEAGLGKLLRDVEIPLSRVLAEMQMAGMRVDTDYLTTLEIDFSRELLRIEKEVWKIAGMEFNLASPKQLQQVLFEKLGLEKTKKTKTGYSTGIDVLMGMSHPVAKKILDFRALSKLLGTYVRALPEEINRSTGKIHTSYNQAVAATGRLSSSNPNLQNIPIRSERGRKIRKAFVPSEGCRFLSADYSQIDLRVLAHLSGDFVLVQAFKNGEDVHRRTAMEVFGVAGDEVTPEIRSQAKAVNFGVVYGQTEYGLSQQTGLSMKEAREFIRKYFERYGGVQDYMNRVIEEAHKGRGVSTILGRRRFLRGIDSKNRNERLMAERMARNTPIQGSAADIIKLAMIKINDWIHEKKLETKMLLNVHDELVFDVPKKEEKEAEEMVRKIMETVMELQVPLVVDTGWGSSWADAHP